MAKPPESGPSSDIASASENAGAHRKPDPKGTAADIERADDESKGRPDHSSKRK